VNYITGMNGSGKSAILAALQICLGAKASATHRGTKLSDLINRGFTGSHALVRVSVRNPGNDGFKVLFSNFTDFPLHIVPIAGRLRKLYTH
jgi:chromosome segregation ATPase